MITARNLASIMLALTLAGCTAAPSRVQDEQPFIARQKAAAGQARQQGDLARALTLWHTVEPLRPGDTEVLEAIRYLRGEIASKAETARNRAEAAYARGDRRGGDRWMRQVLSLQPGDREALAALRESFARRVQAQQAAKQARESAEKVAGEVARENGAPAGEAMPDS